eukprot:5044943-Pyramimonas_sp.AAC.1
MRRWHDPSPGPGALRRSRRSAHASPRSGPCPRTRAAARVRMRTRFDVSAIFNAVPNATTDISVQAPEACRDPVLLILLAESKAAGFKNDICSGRYSGK